MFFPRIYARRFLFEFLLIPPTASFERSLLSLALPQPEDSLSFHGKSDSSSGFILDAFVPFPTPHCVVERVLS